MRGGFEADLNGLQRRLTRWREMHGGRGRRLPEALWEAAVDLARAGDAGAVARVLRLHAVSLRRRLGVEGRRDGAIHRRRPAFVEVAPVAALAGRTGCRVEVVGIGGVRIAMDFADPTSVDLVALASGLLRSGG